MITSEEASLTNGMSNLRLKADNYSGESDDDQPLSHPRFSIVKSNIRPAHFVKPAPQFPPPSNNADMRTVQGLYENYSQKVYMEGYIYKKNDLTVEGKPFGEVQWSKWYMELCGPVLALWDAQSESEVMPQYIHIVDANVDIFTGADREHVFSLNSAGANRFLFDATDRDLLIKWACAIRLSCFECCKLQEIYTKKLITLPSYSEYLAKPINKMEGTVQVRFSGMTEWQKYWAVVTDKKDGMKLFGKKSAKAERISFYESKKAKAPLYTMTHVVQAYTIYPESPQLMESTTVFKIEGVLQDQEKSSSAWIMSSSPKELVQWMVATCDVFKLYGRPARLLDDVNNSQSLNFAEFMNDASLFLDLSDVLTRHNVEAELPSNSQLASILQHKITQQRQQRFSNVRQPGVGLIHQIPERGNVNNSSNHSIMSEQRPVSQRMSAVPSSSLSLNQPQQPQPQQYQQQQQQQQKQKLNQGRMTYASDDDEDEEEEEEESDSDNDSIFNNKKPQTTQESLPTLSTTEEGSFRNSILEDIEKKNQTNTSLSQHSKKVESAAESEEEENVQNNKKTRPQPRLPRPKTTQTQISISDSEEDEEDEEEEEAGYDDSDDDDVPIHQSRQNFAYNHNYDEHYTGMYDTEQYYENGYPPMTEDGPVIPQLGDHFATQNSLLDTFRPDYPSARDQEGYARATGQPLIQVPNKPPEPRAGLVGMISQIEHEKKTKEANKSRMFDKERILERERERYLMEQRAQQQQMMQQTPMMGSGMMNQPMMNSMVNMPMNNPPMSMSNPQMSMNNPQMPMNNPQMPMMGQMPPMMGMMGQPMMYPMMNMPMMPMMMDPHMSMMLMQQQYGQYNPMWNQSQMFGSSQFGDDDEDEDDDVPLGAKENTHKQ
ncbi:hypothetical protein G6F43_002675 [Rhizopus delemar]|nr:hypothetical protein G6F43_002675 [Rhizopus delemar]